MSAAAGSPADVVVGDLHVGVVGGGVIGLSTALNLLHTGFKHVTVIGDAWTPNTTSDGAGAFWERHYDGHAKWARATMAHYTSLIASGKGVETGVGFIDGYQFHHDYQEDYPFKADVPMFRRATAGEVAAASARMGEKLVDGCYWRSVIADSPTYLMWLMRQVRALGGRLVHARVASLESLRPHFDVVVNATGIGAREIASDPAVHVSRGQLIRVYAPHVKRFETVSAGPASEWHGSYVLPRPTSGVVTLGGTFQRRNEYGGVDPADAAGIWERCCALVPELRDGGSVIKIDDWTGMRPCREGDVRLEVEELLPTTTGTGRGGARRLFVVHNYGHAGCGHSLHWGCAQDATALALQAVRSLRASGGASPAPVARFEGKEPVIVEGMHTVLPRLMKQLRDATGTSGATSSSSSAGTAAVGGVAAGAASAAAAVVAAATSRLIPRAKL